MKVRLLVSTSQFDGFKYIRYSVTRRGLAKASRLVITAVTICHWFVL
jgi:hypothetical protein